MADEIPVLDYARPARRKWVLRTVIVVAVIAAGGAVGAAVGDWVQPDLYVFNGSLSVPPSGAGTDMAAVKRAHITAMRRGIPAAAATLSAQGLRISAAEFGDRMALEDVPRTGRISIRCSGRSFDAPLAMVNALVLPYCNNVPGVTVMPGTLGRSTTYAAVGFVAGGAAAGLMIVLRRRQPARLGRGGVV